MYNFFYNLDEPQGIAKLLVISESFLDWKPITLKISLKSYPIKS